MDSPDPREISPTDSEENKPAEVPEKENRKDLWKLAAPIMFYAHVMCRACRARTYRNWVAYQDYGLTNVPRQLCAKCRDANIRIMDIYRNLDEK